jgi:hypothetical protein
MAIILDNFKLATLALTNFATGGAIGTAVATVDIASCFNINQTTAAQTLTLPVPTNAIAGDQIRVTNVGTAAFTILGKVISPGTFSDIFWNGAGYAVDADSGRNQGATVTAATLTVGNNTITHNLALPSGSFSAVNLDIRDSNGSTVHLRRVTANDTANAIVVTCPIAIATPTVFFIVPLV